jgi:hypothetical protein
MAHPSACNTRRVLTASTHTQALSPLYHFDPSIVHAAHIYEGARGSPSRQVKPYDLTTRPEIDMEITDKAIDFMEALPVGSGEPLSVAS